MQIGNEVQQAAVLEDIVILIPASTEGKIIWPRLPEEQDNQRRYSERSSYSTNAGGDRDSGHLYERITYVAAVQQTW